MFFLFWCFFTDAGIRARQKSRNVDMMEIWKQSKALIAVQVDDEVNYKPWFRECTYREKSSSYVVRISMKSGSVLNRCRGRIDDHIDHQKIRT